ncbi:ATP synthase F1 subunit epsilon [Candidatus Nomurabacteria bacterium]|nr:MAG: ATP synthase F1 subunit epsilon [Candidatus Nomurabacteria bacterium]
MSIKQLQLKIITPERIVLDEAVDQVVLPTGEGEITVLPGHIALISSLASGDIVARVNGEDVPMAVSGGFIEVSNDQVKILADFAEHVSDLSDDAVTKARARAEELKRMKDDASVVDFEHYEAELERSLTRVKIADKWKNRKYRM